MLTKGLVQQTFLILLFIFIDSNIVFAETHIMGDISAINFDSISSPFWVEQDIFIPTGRKVVIKPGCVFLFNEYTGLIVSGELTVEGTPANPVVFTSIKDSLYNHKSTELAKPFDWNGIVIDTDATNVKLRNIVLCNSVRGIKSQNENIVIENGLFRNIGQYIVTINDRIQQVFDNLLFSYCPKNEPVTKNKLSQKSDSSKEEIIRIVLPQLKKTMLKINSSPQGAEVYINKVPHKRNLPYAKTPVTINISKPDDKLTLFKVGFKDTMLQLNIIPNTINTSFTTLSPADQALIKKQQIMINERTKAHIGRYCFYSSPFFALAGAILSYLAKNDYDKGKDAGNYLKNTIVNTGPIYDAMKKKYADALEKGNAKRTGSFIVWGLGAATTGVGLVLYF